MPTAHEFDRRKFAIGAATALVTTQAAAAVYATSRTPMKLKSPTPEENVPMQTFDELVEWLTTRTEELRVPGAAVGVTFGEQRFTKGTGIANLDTDDPFTPSTPHGIASLTKILTANAVAAISHTEGSSLDRPVTEVLPDFRLNNAAASSSVTIGHLVSHSGGWADLIEPEPGQDSLDWYAANMSHLPQITTPGEMFSYSNSGFLVAGAVLEQLAGTSYEDSIADLLLDPLRMGNTVFTPTVPGQSAGHDEIEGELKTNPTVEFPRTINPAAGLVSTIEDMLNFVEAHALDGSQRIDPDVVAAMRQPRVAGGSVGPTIVDAIGTGWMLLDVGGEQVLMSQGGDGGRMSAMIAVPSRAFGMVVFANSESAMMLVNEAAFRGLELFTGLVHQEPQAIDLPDADLQNASGRFGQQEWMTFDVTESGGRLQLATSAGGEQIPDLSGAIDMTSANRGYMAQPGGNVWFDFEPNETGAIIWLRFAGRLVPRLE